jgi:SAM-dependent methyltransferase
MKRRGAEKSIGFDITQQGTLNWEDSNDEVLLTTNRDLVFQQGPYDKILLYDVLDHTPNSKSPLQDCYDLLKPDGRIYVRCHHWTGRHGGHLYRTMNKAFVHFLFLPEELQKLGLQMDENIRTVLHPLGGYYFNFNYTKLDVESQSAPIHIDKFFEQHLIQKRIQHLYAQSSQSGWKPEWGFDFCDFVLKRKV